MPVSWSRNIIFIHIPKTAGVSITEALEAEGVWKRNAHHLAARPAPEVEPFQHLTLKQLTSLLGVSYVKNAYVFSVVRNPFDRLVSYYTWMKARNKLTCSFDEFVQGDFDIPDPQIDYLRLTRSGSVDRYLINQVGYYEHLNSLWRGLQKQIGTKRKLPWENKTTHRWYGDYYKDSGTRDFVLDFYAEDFETFGYNRRL